MSTCVVHERFLGPFVVDETKSQRVRSVFVENMAANLEAVLNRMSIFQGEALTKCAAELEDIAHCSNLYKEVTPATMSYLLEFLNPRFPDAVVKAACLSVANSCTTDDLTNCRHYLDCGVAPKCAAVLQKKRTSAPCVFAVLDVVATLCTGSGVAREQFRPLVPDILEAVRGHKTNAEVLFAAACSLATQTLADPGTCLMVARANGLQVLLEIFKWAAKHVARGAAEKKDVRLLVDIMKWSKDAFLNVMRSSENEIDDCAAKVNWGVFGDVIAVDELKMTSASERRKVLSSSRKT